MILWYVVQIMTKKFFYWTADRFEARNPKTFEQFQLSISSSGLDVDQFVKKNL